jgi:hypothetical protein
MGPERSWGAVPASAPPTNLFVGAQHAVPGAALPTKATL